MKFTQFLLMSFEGMLRHKLRTFLTLLGLIVGIASVLVMTGIGRGFAQQANEWLSTLLPNKITLRPGYNPDGPSTALSSRDLALIQTLIAHSPVTTSSAGALSPTDAVLLAAAPRNDIYDLQIRGLDPNQMPLNTIVTTSDFAQIVNATFISGRFFSEREVANQEYVAVVSESMLAALQGNFVMPEFGPAPSTASAPTPEPALAAETVSLFINNLPFRIVGVVQEVGDVFYPGFPQLVVPITLFPKHLRSQSMIFENGSPTFNEIGLLAIDVEHVEPAKLAVERLLRLVRGLRSNQPNDFELIPAQEEFAISQNFSQGITLVLGGIGAISLIVGGIGIMNILLATVAERTREIGVRKAIGASDLDILLQFLLESITICLVGGALGVALSYAIGSFISSSFGGPESIGLRVLIDLRSVVIATASSVICGVVFGLYPAIRAMRLDPIQALRYE